MESVIDYGVWSTGNIGGASSTSNDTEYHDLPLTTSILHLMGNSYIPLHELEKIRREITSIIWFTYRRGYIPIGDDGMTTDRGWGCTLRCGQMVLAQALVRIHLGEDWCWNTDTRDPTYLKILHRFEERRQSPYSIHQIALMGSCEGKEVGQWFGPNTVAQVLKKLVKFDTWSSLRIHVALDNTIVKNDIRELCRKQKHSKKSNKSRNKEPKENQSITEWRPLLLIVPLRLGLSEINPIYVNGLKICFSLHQSLGVIGGKPNQALYLIGCVDDEVIFLDPHTTQRAGFVEDKITDDQKEMDASYHCKYAARIPILTMDPSLAVCFLCKTEGEFEDLCNNFETRIMKESQPLFEVCVERPKHWGPNNANLEEELGATALNDFDELDRQFDDSDEDFEIL